MIHHHASSLKRDWTEADSPPCLLTCYSTFDRFRGRATRSKACRPSDRAGHKVRVAFIDAMTRADPRPSSATLYGTSFFFCCRGDHRDLHGEHDASRALGPEL